MKCGESCELAVQIVQSEEKYFLVYLFYADTGEPFDLTSATEIVALFPGTSGTPVEKRKTTGDITVIGSAGGGKIEIACSTVDTAAMLASPQFRQDLQIVVTISGVAQVDTYSMGQAPVVGTVYSATLDGQVFSYTAVTGDQAQNVFTSLQTQIAAASGLPISAAVNGTGNSATLVLTSTIAGLGFSDVASSGITLTATTANAGTRSIFLLKGVLNIVPQRYSGA